jgi:uncharacterized protein (TIGR02145 family)
MRKPSNLVFAVMFLAGIMISLTMCKKEDPVIEDPVIVATSLAIDAGNGQEMTVQKELSNPVVVIVTDQEGNPFEGGKVNFTVEEGSLSDTSVISGADGKASTNWTLGSTVGTQTLTVTALQADGKTPLSGSPLSITAIGHDKTSIKDIDNNFYKVVQVNDKYWMAENLKTTKYNDGTDIPNTTDSSEWAQTDSAAYCWLDNDIANKNEYGALYNRYTVSNKNLCPTGWHVPSKSEWDALIAGLGGSSIAGGLLKEEGTAHWLAPNTGANNISGFSAFGTGRRSYDSVFEWKDELGSFWSTTDKGGGYSYYLLLRNNNTEAVTNGAADFNYGFSVRCTKD